MGFISGRLSCICLIKFESATFATGSLCANRSGLCRTSLNIKSGSSGFADNQIDIIIGKQGDFFSRLVVSIVQDRRNSTKKLFQFLQHD